MRAGFTLIEVLVALVIFQFGMLALAATAAVSARELATARRLSLAQAATRNRVELLRADACAAPSAGTTRADGRTEYWRVETRGSARIFSDSAEVALPGGRTGVVVRRSWSWCAP